MGTWVHVNILYEKFGPMFYSWCNCPLNEGEVPNGLAIILSLPCVDSHFFLNPYAAGG